MPDKISRLGLPLFGIQFISRGKRDFFSPLPVDSIRKKFQNLIFRQIVFFLAAFIKHNLAVV